MIFFGIVMKTKSWTKFSDDPMNNVIPSKLELD